MEENVQLKTDNKADERTKKVVLKWFSMISRIKEQLRLSKAFIM
jgi:hypothetical protein